MGIDRFKEYRNRETGEVGLFEFEPGLNVYRSKTGAGAYGPRAFKERYVPVETEDPQPVVETPVDVDPQPVVEATVTFEGTDEPVEAFFGTVDVPVEVDPFVVPVEEAVTGGEET